MLKCSFCKRPLEVPDRTGVVSHAVWQRQYPESLLCVICWADDTGVVRATLTRNTLAAHLRYIRRQENGRPLALRAHQILRGRGIPLNPFREKERWASLLQNSKS